MSNKVLSFCQLTKSSHPGRVLERECLDQAGLWACLCVHRDDVPRRGILGCFNV